MEELTFEQIKNAIDDDIELYERVHDYINGLTDEQTDVIIPEIYKQYDLMVKENDFLREQNQIKDKMIKMQGKLITALTNESKTDTDMYAHNKLVCKYINKYKKQYICLNNRIEYLESKIPQKIQTIEDFMNKYDKIITVADVKSIKEEYEKETGINITIEMLMNKLNKMKDGYNIKIDYIQCNDIMKQVPRLYIDRQ